MKVNYDNIKPIKHDLSKELLEHYSTQKLLSVDCEMMGLLPQRDKLCLVQICDAEQTTTLVKIEPPNKATNLKTLFENPEIRKIFRKALYGRGKL